MRGGCIGMDYELYGHIIGIYRSGEGRKVGAGKEGQGMEREGRSEKK